MKKKFIAVILTLTLICSSAFTLASANNIMLGDVNNDGKITAADARLALRAAAKLEKLSEEQTLAADVNFDKKITAVDARTILRAAARIEDLPKMPTQAQPSTEPTTKKPSSQNTTKPSAESTTKPSAKPTTKPSTESTTKPSSQNTTKPSAESTTKPSAQNTTKPSAQATTKPSSQPTTKPSTQPTTKPSTQPTTKPSTQPTTKPSTQPTTKPSTQPTTKPSTESTTKPSTQPTTKPNNDVQGKYPAVIDAFLNGNYYLEAITESDGTTAEMKVAMSDKGYEIAAAAELAEGTAIDLGFMQLGETLYVKYPNALGIKKFFILDEELKTAMEFDSEEMFGSLFEYLDFTSIKINKPPVKTKGNYNGKACDIYTFKTEKGKIAFYTIGEDVKKINIFDTAGNEQAIIDVKLLSADIPENMLSTKGHKEADLLEFFADMMVLMPDDTATGEQTTTKPKTN